MIKAKILASCLLLLPLAGTAPVSVPGCGVEPKPLFDQRVARRAQLLAALREGAELFRTRRYAEALLQFESIRKSAIDIKEFDLAARATGNAGGCHFALHQFHDALRRYLEARHLAVSAHDSSASAALEANIASLYSQMGERDAAARWLETSAERLKGEDRREHLAQVEIELAALRARQGRKPEALELFRNGIAHAEGAGNTALFAVGWNKLGEELLRPTDPAQRDLPGAERALLEAYRIRKWKRLPLDGSYTNLGKLRLAQGNLAEASTLLDHAVELVERGRGPMPTWDPYYARGRVRLAQGRLRKALEDLRRAIRLARVWRWSVPGDEASRIDAEGLLAQVHSALIEAGNRLYLQTRDPALLRETFEAAEENRATSLQAVVSRKRTQSTDLPQEYWNAVSRLQTAEVEAIRNRNGRTEKAVAAARAELVRLEASLLPENKPLPAGSLERVQAALGSGTAMLSYSLGDAVSWVWALDSSGLAVYALPPRSQLESEVGTAVRAMREDLPEAGRSSERLYRTLFGRLAPRFRNKTRWLLALDSALFEVPIAALVEPRRGALRYVVERHVTQVIPGAGYWLDAIEHRSERGSELFVGLGDPIYNLADGRVHKRPGEKYEWPSPFNLIASGGSGVSGLALPRLVGSRAELEACARAWGGEHVLLEGQDASTRELRRQLPRNPSVIHFATHFLESAETPGSGLIALSLANRREPEFLSAREIAQWRMRGGLVVMSGCDSAGGQVLPGTGLLGLTRAWLMAGANAVVGSRWATPDEDGAMFTALYRSLRTDFRGAAGQALHRAQLAMLRSGGWRARPRYWGAYFVVGGE